MVKIQRLTYRDESSSLQWLLDSAFFHPVKHNTNVKLQKALFFLSILHYTLSFSMATTGH